MRSARREIKSRAGRNAPRHAAGKNVKHRTAARRAMPRSSRIGTRVRLPANL